MKMVKSLMLGTAAGFVALTGAQAADLPVKAKAVEYVKICSLYGAGFYYIPGTDTCIRIGGAIRLDTGFNTQSTYDVPLWQGGAGGAQQYGRNYFSTRERFTMFVDTRTATEYGVLRTYATMQFDFATGRENIAGGFVENDYLFIQFAGFTFGKAVSMFDPQWALAKPHIGSGFLAGSNDATGIPQLAYTASFGNGLSATISLEDGQPYRTAGIINTSAGFIGPFAPNTSNGLSTGIPLTQYGTSANSFFGNAVVGDHVPDIVGNLRLDQAWGSLHFAAAAHEDHGTYYTSTLSDSGHPASTWGYAVSGAFELKNLPTGVGDSFKAEATFANGAVKYVFGGTYDTNGAGRFATSTGANGITFGYILDGVYTGTNSTNGSSIQKSDAWDVSAYYEHYWTPNWRTSVFGSYSKISYGSGNAALLAAFNGAAPTATNVLAGTALGGTFNLGIAQIGTRTAWTPVQNLTLSAEFLYTRLNQNLTGSVIATAVSGNPAPIGGSFVPKDQSLYNGAVQIQRSF
jgi:porin-like protein